MRASDEGLRSEEKVLVEVLPPGETQVTLPAGLVYTSGPVLEGPEDQPMEDVFSEVHQLLGTGPDCLILKVGLHTWGGSIVLRGFNFQPKGSGFAPYNVHRLPVGILGARCPLTPFCSLTT